jgi:hypothetical protein
MDPKISSVIPCFVLLSVTLSNLTLLLGTLLNVALLSVSMLGVTLLSVAATGVALLNATRPKYHSAVSSSVKSHSIKCLSQ